MHITTSATGESRSISVQTTSAARRKLLNIVVDITRDLKLIIVSLHVCHRGCLYDRLL